MGSGRRHEFCCDGAYEGWGCTCASIKPSPVKRSFVHSFTEEKRTEKEMTEAEIRREIMQGEIDVMQDEIDEFDGYSDYKEEY